MARSFEKDVADTVKVIRNLLAMDDKAPSQFHFSVVAEGRVRDGEVNIQFRLGTTSYDSDLVKGNDVHAVVTEYLRRIGWQKAHEYLALPAVEERRLDA